MNSTSSCITPCSAARAGARPAASMLVFADDWGRHPSSCQHLVRRLLRRYPACWVNTIGTRTPRWDWATLTRGLEKVRHWLGPRPAAATLPDHLRVVSPRMWPWFRSRFDRSLNRRLLVRQLRPVIETLPAPVVAVTTLPVVADLVGSLPVERWVYYCVDDFGQWPGLDQAALRRLDEKLTDRAEVLIAVSDHLREALGRRGRAAHLLTHGVDLDFWTQDPGGNLPDVVGLERPLVVFWGVVDRRMDVTFIRRLAADLTAGTIVLAGPRDDPDPELFQIPRVTAIGAQPFAQLPRLAYEAGVLILPYGDMPATRAMQPLK